MLHKILEGTVGGIIGASADFIIGPIIVAFLGGNFQDEHKNIVKEFMQENFKKQADGTFTREYMIETQVKLVKLLKPEYVEEVKTAIAHLNCR